MIVKSYIKKGNSCPIVLENNGQHYFVKLSAGMSGKYALISEWLGCKLGGQLNINTQKPSWIELKSDVIIAPIHIEVKELIYKSLGLNIGFQYREKAIEIKGDEIQTLDKTVAEEIFLFDLVMINIDRTVSNTNLMSVDDKILSIDYESSLLFQDVLGNKNLLENHGILTCFKNSPLYKEIDQNSINNFIKKIAAINFKDAIAEIPQNILSSNERNLFLKGIEEKKANKWFLKQIMEKLKHIIIETPAEQKSRINRNQAAFKRKFSA